MEGDAIATGALGVNLWGKHPFILSAHAGCAHTLINNIQSNDNDCLLSTLYVHVMQHVYTSC